MIKRTNGKLNIKENMKMENMTMKLMTMKFNRYNFTSLTNIYLELYLNPKAGKKLYFIYRIILIVLFIYNFIYNNPTLLLELLENFNNNYLNQLHEDSFINIKENISSESGGQGSSGDSGPPGPNPNPFSGQEPMYEVENTRRRQEENKRQSGSSEQNKPDNPYKGPLSGIKHNMQFFYDPERKLRVQPELLHFNRN